MLLKYYFFVLLILFYLSCSNTGTDTDSLRHAAAKEFQSEANFFNIDFDTTYKYTLLDDTLDSPLKKVDFLLYRFTKIEPNSSVIVYKSNDRIYILNNSIDSLEYELNILLLSEDLLSEQDLLKLAKFFIKIQSPVHNMVHLINSWKDVQLQENEKFPDELKSVITSPRVLKNKEQQTLEFFSWYAGSAELYKTTITYSEKKISIKTDKILNIGHVHIIL